jgi:hypothetical protein
MEIVCAEVVQFDPVQAVALAEHYSGGYIPLLENLMSQWAEHDEAAAAAYASGKPSGEARNRLLSRVALIRAQSHPAEAAKLAAEQIAPGDIQDEAIIGVLHQWARQDPISALAWVRLFPSGELRARALQELEAARPRIR